MASNAKQRSPRRVDSSSRPLLLKDFLLLDDSGSCSSSGFNSFPRFPSCNAKSPKLLDELHRASRGPPPAKLRLSRSRSAAEAAICALQKLLTSLKSHSSKKKKPSPATTTEKKDAEMFVQVRVKDILRWRSFRVLIDGLDGEEKALPLDCFGPSPDERSIFDASVGPSLKREDGKWNVGGEDPMMAGTGTALCSCNDHVGPETEQISNNDDDEEQHSPVSVLHSPFRDDGDDSASSFDQSLANVERTKQRLLESIKWLESLAGVDLTDSEEDEADLVGETIEPKKKGYRCKVDEAGGANLGCSRKEPEMTEEMEEWKRFDEQRSQLGSELELGMLNALLDELLFNLVGRFDGF